MASEDHHLQDQQIPDHETPHQQRRRQRDQKSLGRLVRVHRPQLRGQDKRSGEQLCLRALLPPV